MKKLLCLLFLSTTLSSPARPQATDSPAAQEFQTWLTLFNTGDRAPLLQFLQKYRPDSAAHVDDELGFRARTGGFDIKKVEESTPSRFVALIQEHGSDQFARAVCEVDPNPPHVINKFELRIVPRPDDFAIPRLSDAEAVAAFRSYLDKSASDGKFSGAALVAQNGKVRLAQAYGMADREKKIPNQLSTQFRIGSMNKMFTAVSILQLVQAGKIKLTDPLAKFLPDYANKDLASKVTIHHLLTHTGGTGDIFGPDFEKHRLELRTLQDYVKLYQNRPLKFEPGAQWDYSNYGFLLLGVVIEKVSGESYYDYVREHVFKPAGMNSTDSLPEDIAVAQRSVGYMQPDPQSPLTPNTDTLPYRGTSAGGGYSTVEDLFRFANAIESHKLLDAEHTTLLVTGKADTPSGTKYAYGFMDTTQSGLHCFGHGGGAPGMNGDLRICPESGYVVAVLSNLDPPAAQRPADFIAARLPTK
jgi:CubicO group peptidase (beta-lactamase class C family)